MKKISACTLDCPDACSWVVDTEKRTIRGNPDHPFTAGFTCKKGSGFFARLDSDERIVAPLLRTKDGFEQISWDTAMDMCAERLSALRDEPERVLHIRGYGYRGIMARASKAFFEAFGSSTTSGSPCDNAGCTASELDFGGLLHNDPHDILNATRILNWGKDFTRSSSHLAQLVSKARKNGAPMLTISIGGDDNADISDEMVKIRPGTDRFLAAAVIRIMQENGTLHPEAVERVANFPQFLNAYEDVPLEELLQSCEVSREDAELVAFWLTKEGPTATIVGWGLQRHKLGGSNVRFINAAVMLSGNVGVSGGGVYYNISSGRAFRNWNAMVGGSPAAPLENRRAFPLHDLGRTMLQADPPVDFVWIDGANPVNQLPNGLDIATAFHRAGFVVAVEAFMNDTAMRADLILPPALILEKTEVLGSCMHRFLNVSHQLFEPRGECRSDYDILADLGARLSPPITFPAPEECIALSLEGSGVSQEELFERGFVKTGEPEIAFEGMNFDHPDGLYRLPEELPAEPALDFEYPLQLLTVVSGKYLHSQIPESEQRGKLDVYISPDSPAKYAVKACMDGDVWLVTPAGAMEVRINYQRGLHPRTVLVRRGGWIKYGVNANILIEPMETDMGGGIAYYSQRARLEKR